MGAAWICLPAAILSAFACTLAPIREASASSARSYGWNEQITLKLLDGREISGRYRGTIRSGRRLAEYPARYDSWRRTLSAPVAPALAESVLVTRPSGEPVRGPFRGFAIRALLIGSADSCANLIVPFDQVAGLHRAVEAEADSVRTTIPESWVSAPLLDGVALESGGTTIVVPASMITGHWGESHAAEHAAAWVIVGVIVLAVSGLFALGAAIDEAGKGKSTRTQWVGP